jgi:hypothetical protein
MNSVSFRLACLLATLFLASTASCFASPLTDALAGWDPPQAYLCPAPSGPFPSKYSTSDPQHCDDGDMTLFNGLICVAGDQRGCDAARLAQGTDGRWWRSPRRIGWTYPQYDVSFSPDQALGVMLYTGFTKDRAAYDRWVQWIYDNRPCVVQIGSTCVQKGWLRYCSDDVVDKRCTFRPDDCTFLTATGQYLGSSSAGLCAKVFAELPAPLIPFPQSTILPVPDQVLGSAGANQPGFSLHLAAVELLLARILKTPDPNHALDQAGTILVTKQDQNPFFQYLANQPNPQVIIQLLKLCPDPTRPSNGRTQWSWERDQKDQAWLASMYWDCIFLGKLL